MSSRGLVLLVLGCAVAVFIGTAFVVPRHPEGARAHSVSSWAAPETPEASWSPLAAFALSTLAGLMVGLTTASTAAWATLPLPPYLSNAAKGIDAANVGERGGQTTFLERSILENLAMPQTMEELKGIKEALAKAPSTEVRIEQQRQKQLELYKTERLPESFGVKQAPMKA